MKKILWVKKNWWYYIFHIKGRLSFLSLRSVPYFSPIAIDYTKCSKIHAGITSTIPIYETIFLMNSKMMLIDTDLMLNSQLTKQFGNLNQHKYKILIQTYTYTYIFHKLSPFIKTIFELNTWTNKKTELRTWNSGQSFLISYFLLLLHLQKKWEIEWKEQFYYHFLFLKKRQ